MRIVQKWCTRIPKLILLKEKGPCKMLKLTKTIKRMRPCPLTTHKHMIDPSSKDIWPLFQGRSSWGLTKDRGQHWADSRSFLPSGTFYQNLSTGYLLEVTSSWIYDWKREPLQCFDLCGWKHLNALQRLCWMVAPTGENGSYENISRQQSIGWSRSKALNEV